MTEPEPPEDRNPFEGWPMFGDLARLFSNQGAVNWDVARQTAQWIATEGTSEPNTDPIERMRMEELVRVADLQVGEVTGLSTSVAGGLLTVVPVTRADWALHSLEAYRPYLERLAETLSQSSEGSESMADPATQLYGDLGKVVGPVLLGVQSGYMVGQLARRSLGQYDVLLPRPPADQLLTVPSNLKAFVEEWGVDADDLRMWVCLREVTSHAVLGRPHVRGRLHDLIEQYVSSFEMNPDAFEASIGDLDPTDPSTLQKALGNPETLLGAVQTDAQREVLDRIGDLLAVVSGYVDHVLDTIGTNLIGSYGMLTEALQRRRTDPSEGERFAGRLIGISIEREQYERGTAFVRGVVERAGDEGARRLWLSERFLPTPAELDAPGLWLARIDLPD
ncbi:MAG TPA: zinc-dependent metalloprotease [Acidimicrobiales bacterium]|nr:zinc-dependent metalloprotease [Acidimicrobiales bacterium]